MITKSPTTCPKEIREMIRTGEWTQPTPGISPGHVQANLAVLPQEFAFDFLLFTQRNPQPCPVLEVIESGNFEPVSIAPGADLRTDLPQYMIYEHGELVGKVDNLIEYWRDDLVSFLMGCSFSFENAFHRAGIPVRHLEEGKSDPTFISNIETIPAGVFSGPMVVSMWPVHWTQVSRVIQITSRYPGAHGAPVHIGDPDAIGISDLYKPEYGDTVKLREGEVPVFWGCGVTPQEVALRSKPSLMMTHSAGHMFVTDLQDEDIAII